MKGGRVPVLGPGVLGLVKAFRGVTPTIDVTALVAESAAVIGDVVIGPNASVWYQCVLRGDVNYIRIGRDTNLQDGCIVHVHQKTLPCLIGDEVTAGHGVILHACTIKDRCLLGIGATVMDGAIVGEESIVAAGSLVTPGTLIPPRRVAMGRPARVVRELTEEDLGWIKESAANYVRYAREVIAGVKEGN
ncbi:MAG: gamma carbonic anhydrase family protein [Deltaproteobacteria bacterium RBG_13_65_10]|nr:MAG: gamma carbonic anhydrase family protein [Deltaproteobacteria bacterium RBG_13_65_10]